jgi:hypothetical protein
MLWKAPAGLSGFCEDDDPAAETQSPSADVPDLFSAVKLTIAAALAGVPRYHR